MIKKILKLLKTCANELLDNPRDPLFVVSYTVDANAMEGGEDFIDHYEVVETLQEARDLYERVIVEDGAGCAAISFVVEATEPDWEGR